MSNAFPIRAPALRRRWSVYPPPPIALAHVQAACGQHWYTWCDALNDRTGPHPTPPPASAWCSLMPREPAPVHPPRRQNCRVGRWHPSPVVLQALTPVLLPWTISFSFFEYTDQINLLTICPPYTYSSYSKVLALFREMRPLPLIKTQNERYAHNNKQIDP